MGRPRPYDAPPGRMSDAQYDATLGELRRVILGGRPERPELQPTKREIQQHFKMAGRAR